MFRGVHKQQVRILIKQADPKVVEEWKWRGVPVWSHAGMICTGETYKNVVKMTFAKGSLEDPSGRFNSSLEGNTRRAIDFHEDTKLRKGVEGAHSRRCGTENVAEVTDESELNAKLRESSGNALHDQARVAAAILKSSQSEVFARANRHRLTRFVDLMDSNPRSNQATRVVL